MNGELILAEYEQIAALTHRMLEAARKSEWDALVALERDCGRHFARVMSNPYDDAAGDEHYRRRKAALIHRILDEDAEIRLLVEPWLRQLSSLVGSTRQQAQLQRAYGGGD